MIRALGSALAWGFAAALVMLSGGLFLRHDFGTLTAQRDRTELESTARWVESAVRAREASAGRLLSHVCSRDIQLERLTLELAAGADETEAARVSGALAGAVDAPVVLARSTARTEPCLRIGERLLPLSRFHLHSRARFLEPLALQPRVGQCFGDFFDTARRRLCAFAQPVDLVAARDDTHLRIVAALPAQPVATNPDSIARDERLAIGKLAAAGDCLRRRGGDTNANEQRRDGRGGLHMVQHTVSRDSRLAARFRLDERHPAFGKIGERTRDAIDALDAAGL